MKGVFLCFGSNVGEREAYLNKAVSSIRNRKDIQIRAVSSIYETEPWGKKNQNFFLNQVVEIETRLDPQRLLIVCQEIEKALEGEKKSRWGPRTIDVDLLLFGDRVVDEDTIQVPHPRLLERKFVLVPLAEVAPSVIIPKYGKTVRDALNVCLDRGSVKLYEKVQ